jgi:di/tricarboxylate transporter
MTTDTPIASPTERSSTATYLAKLLAGPIAFAIVMAVPVALSYEGRVTLATFVCAIIWWMTQPLPWAVAAMLPFLVFPAAGVMNIADTMRLYGQPIFFWIKGLGIGSTALPYVAAAVVGVSTNFISGTALYGSVSSRPLCRSGSTRLRWRS